MTTGTFRLQSRRVSERNGQNVWQAHSRMEVNSMSWWERFLGHFYGGNVWVTW